VAEGLHALRTQGPFRLLFTDLMLPDGSGQQVLQALAAEPALRGRCTRGGVQRRAVGRDTRQRLEGLGVDETIAKPASLAQLLGCVQRALQAGRRPRPPPRPTPTAPRSTVTSRRPRLFDAYRASCRRQFAHDRKAGDAALAAADLPALRRLAHSLKSVLQTLGHDADSAQARQLEADAAAGRSEAAQQGWARLGAALDRLQPP
jgi:CheY-like chemotaxis protein